jgi:DNA processing protein
MTEEDRLHWLALRLTPGLGTRKTLDLLARVGSPKALFRCSASELEAQGLSGGVARSLASGCTFDDAVEQHEKLKTAGAELVPWTDDRYPPALREIYDPPVMLFVQGRVELLSSIMLAVVGSRRATPYGMAATERLAGDLAKAGFTIVSGMARGIDSAAHKAALEAGGNTAAVFGSGLDVIYPAENRRLAEDIGKRGLLISEYPMASPAYPQNFPVRNRIVSGMSAGVIVVEGAQYSGSTITARLSLDQGREVFAVPGNITSKMSWGPNLLIKQGAALIQEWTDVLAGLSLETQQRLAREQLRDVESSPGDTPAGTLQAQFDFGPLAEIAKKVLSFLHVETQLNLDDIVVRLEDQSPSEIIAALFELELAGRVRQLAGRNFVKVWTE